MCGVGAPRRLWLRRSVPDPTKRAGGSAVSSGGAREALSQSQHHCTAACVARRRPEMCTAHDTRHVSGWRLRKTSSPGAGPCLIGKDKLYLVLLFAWSYLRDQMSRSGDGRCRDPGYLYLARDRTLRPAGAAEPRHSSTRVTNGKVHISLSALVPPRSIS